MVKLNLGFFALLQLILLAAWAFGIPPVANWGFLITLPIWGIPSLVVAFVVLVILLVVIFGSK